MPFRDVVGHRRLISLLSRAIARETLPPSLLFAGPAGIGKRQVAMAVAEAVNCLNRLTSSDLSAGALAEVDACGECASCKRIARAVHLDVITIAPGDSGT